MNNWVALLIRIVLERISPEIAKAIKDGLDKAREKAKETKNPFDDLLIDCLIWLLGAK